jgi:hypothetical protein
MHRGTRRSGLGRSVAGPPSEGLRLPRRRDSRAGELEPFRYNAYPFVSVAAGLPSKGTQAIVVRLFSRGAFQVPFSPTSQLDMTMTPQERLRKAREEPLPYEDRILAMVDVLGWSDLSASPKAMDSVPPAASEAAEAISMIRHSAVESTAEVLKADPDVNIDLRASNFSDTFVISSSATNLALAGLAGNLAALCQRLLQAGRYTRGAIVRGLVRHTDEVLFGPAVPSTDG